MRAKNLIKSFNYALDGVIHTIKTQRNMRIHISIGILVLLFASLLNVSRLELLVLLITVGMVLTFEMVNTAIEEVVNLVTQEIHPIAKIVKNVAAGAVLITSVMAVGVGYIIFIDRILLFDLSVLNQVIASPYLTLVALLVAVSLSITIKALGGRTELLRGGMPSGHTAIAFSLATAIMFMGNRFASFVGLLLAFLVAQSRVEGKIHTWLEVFAGAIIGFLVTLILFQVKG